MGAYEKVSGHMIIPATVLGGIGHRNMMEMATGLDLVHAMSAVATRRISPRSE